ncbi:MAG: glycosyltransferase family 4 protein [Bacteroidales bacterium]
MNIVFYAHFAGSPYHGMVYGHYYLAREWVKLGHQVTIIASSNAHTRFKQPVQNKEITEEIIDGVKFVWLPTPTYDPKSGLGRILNILAFTYKCYSSKIPVNQSDLVICSSHYPLPIYAASRFARKFKARLVFEVRDLWPLSLIELGNASRYNPFIVLLQKAEDYAYRHANTVVSVLPEAKAYMMSRGMEAEKFIYVPNGANLQENTNQSELPDSYIQRLESIRSNGNFIIGYAGKIGLSNALHTLIESLVYCENEDIVVAFLGSGAFAEDLKKKAIHLGQDHKIHFFDPVTKDQVPDFLSRLDATYIGLQQKPIFRFGVSPTKLNDFMLAAKPIIYAVDAPDNTIEQSRSGISCLPENPEALALALKSMKNLTQQERDQMGTNGRKWVIENRDYKLLAMKFLNAVFKDKNKN